MLKSAVAPVTAGYNLAYAGYGLRCLPPVSLARHDSWLRDTMCVACGLSQSVNVLVYPTSLYRLPDCSLSGDELSYNDVEDVKFVINFDYPSNSEDYVHRIGRTGRSDKTGTAYTFFTPNNQSKAADLVAVLREAKQVINPKLQEMAETRNWGGGGRSRGGRNRYRAKNRANNNRSPSRSRSRSRDRGGRGGNRGVGGGGGGGVNSRNNRDRSRSRSRDRTSRRRRSRSSRDRSNSRDRSPRTDRRTRHGR